MRTSDLDSPVQMHSADWFYHLAFHSPNLRLRIKPQGRSSCRLNCWELRTLFFWNTICWFWCQKGCLRVWFQVSNPHLQLWNNLQLVAIERFIFGRYCFVYRSSYWGRLQSMSNVDWHPLSNVLSIPNLWFSDALRLIVKKVIGVLLPSLWAVLQAYYQRQDHFYESIAPLRQPDPERLLVILGTVLRDYLKCNSGLLQSGQLCSSKSQSKFLRAFLQFQPSRNRRQPRIVPFLRIFEQIYHHDQNFLHRCLPPRIPPHHLLLLQEGSTDS
jgi:hypothetical protein